MTQARAIFVAIIFMSMLMFFALGSTITRLQSSVDGRGTATLELRQQLAPASAGR
ncbi:MAG TPA: hypothetical protein VNE62_05440 [Actinomycetota bacterium]|nr:hypothetical protein [Actinomycetota bacterium]